MAWGALIGAGISAGASLLARKDAQDAQAENINQQREFAKQGIRWKVADALKAGIHPLYALGSQTTSFTPSSVGSSDLSSAFASFGQDFSGPVNRTRTQPERETAQQRQLAQLSLERAGLENELLRARILTEQARLEGPAMPSIVDGNMIPGQGDAVRPTPMEPTMTTLNRPHSEPSAVPGVGYLRTPTGMMPVKSDDAAQRLEDDMIGNLAWSLRNRLAPSFQGGMSPPPLEYLPPGYDYWWYNPLAQEYQPAKKEAPAAPRVPDYQRPTAPPSSWKWR